MCPQLPCACAQGFDADRHQLAAGILAVLGSLGRHAAFVVAVPSALVPCCACCASGCAHAALATPHKRTRIDSTETYTYPFMCLQLHMAALGRVLRGVAVSAAAHRELHAVSCCVQAGRCRPHTVHGLRPYTADRTVMVVVLCPSDRRQAQQQRAARGPGRALQRASSN